MNNSFGRIWLLVFLFCTTLKAHAEQVQPVPDVLQPPAFQADFFVPEVNAQDPYESFNRKVFKFNDVLDKTLVTPLTHLYLLATPRPIEIGVSNVFSYVGEFGVLINQGLQMKWSDGGKTLLRLVTNGVLGVAGIWDVAKHLGLPKADEDFGQTLGYWGVPSGAYLVLPLMGPSTVRGALAFPVDWYTDPTSHINHDTTKSSLTTLDVLDTRASLFEVERLVQGDRYSFIRDAYLQRRAFLSNDGKVEDDFLDEW